ncbi:twin-arginine translocase TatA/TatE family subunit [Salegentibacter chungangensis]|uniref:Sec-independent protein translocase protein TatA n=1 Tax=Salegentibacter chungangensis TaxID=1335724 RepID=A0ABW3NNY7_9FLAO
MNAFILPLAIGAPQIILIVIVILLLFGGRKIPELMRGLGSGIKEFKDASKDDDKSNPSPDDSNEGISDKKK